MRWTEERMSMLSRYAGGWCDGVCKNVSLMRGDNCPFTWNSEDVCNVEPFPKYSKIHFIKARVPDLQKGCYHSEKWSFCTRHVSFCAINVLYFTLCECLTILLKLNAKLTVLTPLLFLCHCVDFPYLSRTKMYLILESTRGNVFIILSNRSILLGTWISVRDGLHYG